jgi:hypothetical protein
VVRMNTGALPVNSHDAKCNQLSGSCVVVGNTTASDMLALLCLTRSKHTERDLHGRCGIYAASTDNLFLIRCKMHRASLQAGLLMVRFLVPPQGDAKLQQSISTHGHRIRVGHHEPNDVERGTRPQLIK